MIKCIYLFLLILLPLSNVFAEEVTLNWDASPTSDVVGYKIYYKLNSTELPFDGIGAIEGPSPVDVGDLLSATLTGLIDNSVYYFTVTAYDAAGYESSYSNIISNREMVALTRPPEQSVNEPVPVTFQWSFSSAGAALNYTLYYGTDPALATTTGIVDSSIQSPPLNRTSIVILTAAFFIIALIWRTVPRRRYQLATATLAFSLALTACGGGGGGGDAGSTKSSTETAPATISQSVYSVDMGSSDYYQAYDLQPGTTYYWKVDGVDATDSTQVYTSTVASFTTESL